MKLSETLLQIEYIAKSKGFSTPYIVGGLPRDKILKKYNDFNDIDITTGDASVHKLAIEVARTLNKYVNSYKVLPDGHAKIIIDNISFDFSSNFKMPGISYLLEKVHVPNITEMHKEIYSRDFTCNALLMTMDLKKIMDPTGLSISDIKRKIIKTCLPPNLTLGYSNNRIVRACYLSAKLDFDIDENVLEWIRNNPDAVANIKPQYFISRIKKGLLYNYKRVEDFLNKTNLWNQAKIINGLNRK